MKDHTMQCPYPEGCSCGASEWNRLESKYNALKILIRNHKEESLATGHHPEADHRLWDSARKVIEAKP